MKYKDNVILFGIKPEITSQFSLIEKVIMEVAGREATITSAVDSKHRTTIHLRGYAVDIRIRDDDPATELWREGVIDEIIKLLREGLPKGFDVVRSKRCIHIEYDFKKVDCRG